MFQLFQAIKRHAAAVLEQRYHGSGGLVIFFRTDAFGFGRREHFAAQVAAQAIQFVRSGCQRRLAHDSHQRPGFFLWIDFAFFAAWAVIAGVQRGMWNHHFLGAGVGGSAVASVTLRLFFGLLLRRIGGRKHGAGLLRRAWCRQHARQRVQRFLEFFVIRFAQWSFARVVQHAVQFFQIHVHTFGLYAHSNSRNLRCSGKPSICFTGRVCSKVGARCPRPAVVPITCQLAAR